MIFDVVIIVKIPPSHEPFSAIFRYSYLIKQIPDRKPGNRIQAMTKYDIPNILLDFDVRNY